ncbi:hypothetical protein N9D44_01765 [Pontimonas sp.]|nr:hypothetical protein [Pontimonas sp.]
MIMEPNFIHLPDLKYPREVKKAIKAMDLAVSLWAEEDTEYAVRQQAVTDAERADAKALKEAALAGEPDPGTDAIAQAQRALLYQEQRLKASIAEVNRATSDVWQALKEHRSEVIAEACAKAEAGVEVWREDVASLYGQAREIQEKRRVALAGLRFVSQITDTRLSYDPSFPVDGDFRLPNTNEKRVLDIATLLRKVYQEELTVTPEA